MVYDQTKLLYLHSKWNDNLLGDWRTFWNHGDGEKDTIQRHGGSTVVESMTLLGTIGGVTNKNGELHPVNVALNFIIRVMR
jgi:hypothetical protein